MPQLRYMLDTGIVPDLVRRPHGDTARRAIALEPGSMAISIIVAAELRYGAERHGSTRLKRQLDAVLSAIEALPLTEPADQTLRPHPQRTRADRSPHRPQRPAHCRPCESP